MRNLLSVGFVLVYVVLVGAATFFEKPATKYMDPVQLNAALAIGGVPASLIALFLRQRPFPDLLSWGIGLGIGTLLAVGTIFYLFGLMRLPVALAATISTTFVLVTDGMAFYFLHEPVTWPKILGIVLTVGGVMLLSSQS